MFALTYTVSICLPGDYSLKDKRYAFLAYRAYNRIYHAPIAAGFEIIIALLIVLGYN